MEGSVASSTACPGYIDQAGQGVLDETHWCACFDGAVHTPPQGLMVRVSSNGKASRDLLVTIKTRSDPQPQAEALCRWVLTRLPWNHLALYHHISYGGCELIREYQYRVVWNVRVVRCFNSDPGAPSHCYSVWIAIHLEGEHAWEVNEDTGLIQDPKSESALSADLVAERLSICDYEKPWFARMLRTKWDLSGDVMGLIIHFLEEKLVTENVLSIGVSAVDPRRMTGLWREMTQPPKHSPFMCTWPGLIKAPMMLLAPCPDGSCDSCAFCYDWRDEFACEPDLSKIEQTAFKVATEEGPIGFHWVTANETSHRFQGMEWDVHNAAGH